MDARQFYNMVVKLRKAQRDYDKLPSTRNATFKSQYEEIVDAEIECVEEDADTALYGTPSCSIFHTKGTLRYTLDTPGVSATCFFIHQLQHALRLAGLDK